MDSFDVAASRAWADLSGVMDAAIVQACLDGTADSLDEEELFEALYRRLLAPGGALVKLIGQRLLEASDPEIGVLLMLICLYGGSISPGQPESTDMDLRSEAHAEIELWVQHIESIAESLRATPGTGAEQWEDHRTEAMADLWDTLDRIEPGLGRRAQQAFHPSPVLATEAPTR